MRREFIRFLLHHPKLRVILSVTSTCAPSASTCVVEGPLATLRHRGLWKAFPPTPLFSEFANPYGTLSLASSDRTLSFPRSSTAETE
jgi:hypothetical protein